MRVLRTLFLLLVLANLLLFAAGKGYLGGGNGGEPERLANQLNPDKIAIVRNGPPSPPAEVAQSAPAASAEAASKPQADIEPAAEVCRRLAPLARDQAERIAEMARARAPQVKLVQQSLEAPSSFWVFIPPQPDRAEVNKRLDELRAAGVKDKDFYVVQESGANHYAISLGLFKSDGMARNLVERLRAKGVTGAHVVARESATAKVSVEVRGGPGEIDALLAQAASSFPDLGAQPCAAAR